jgi:hypothetical protein
MMLDRLKHRIKAMPLALPYILGKSLFTKPRAQNDEEAILR